jgi:hypothetical protein
MLMMRSYLYREALGVPKGTRHAARKNLFRPANPGAMQEK